MSCFERTYLVYYHYHQDSASAAPGDISGVTICNQAFVITPTTLHLLYILNLDNKGFYCNWMRNPIFMRMSTVHNFTLLRRHRLITTILSRGEPTVAILRTSARD